MIKTLIKIESLIIFLAALYFYNKLNGNWLMFFILWLTPDISILGYLKNKKLGAWSYNVFHNYILPTILMFWGLWWHIELALLIGIIWTSHVSLDRFLGFGLKYTSSFKDSHIQRI